MPLYNKYKINNAKTFHIYNSLYRNKKVHILGKTDLKLAI